MFLKVNLLRLWFYRCLWLWWPTLRYMYVGYVILRSKHRYPTEGSVSIAFHKFISSATSVWGEEIGAIWFINFNLCKVSGDFNVPPEILLWLFFICFQNNKICWRYKIKTCTKLLPWKWFVSFNVMNFMYTYICIYK